MKITIYELLGLVKDGKAPKTIKYDNYIWTLRTQFNDYWNDASYLITNGFDEWENSKDFLKETVEIIEEEKEIEKLQRPTLDEYIHITGEDLYKQDMKLYDKIDELIDEVKKLKEDKKYER